MRTETTFGDGPYTVKIKTCTIRLDRPMPPQDTIRDPRQAVPVLNSIFAELDDDQEHFVALYLDSRNTIISFKVLFSGDMREVVVGVDNVIRHALIWGSRQIIVAHNHPGGILKFSRADINITKKMIQAMKVFEIELLDHIVFTPDGKLRSMKEDHLIPTDTKFKSTVINARAGDV